MILWLSLVGLAPSTVPLMGFFPRSSKAILSCISHIEADLSPMPVIAVDFWVGFYGLFLASKKFLIGTEP